MQRKVYISGPMTGVPDYKEKFNAVAAELEEKGHTVLNPALLPKGLHYSEYFPICLAMLEAAETVLMLPGWGKSNGACLEHQYARTVGKQIEYRGDSKNEKPKRDLRGINW